MEPVLCDICKKVVSPLDCWCVIDTKTHSRQYECKKICTPPPAPQPLSLPLEPFELEIEDGIRDVEQVAQRIEEQRVTEWTEAYRRPGLFQRVRQWLQTPTGYTKVKTS